MPSQTTDALPHYLKSVALADQSQLIAIEVLKQDTALFTWSIAAVIPGVLTLADKLAVLRDGTVLPWFNVIYLASMLSFLTAIAVTVFVYWRVNSWIGRCQGHRVRLLQISETITNAARKGQTDLDLQEQHFVAAVFKEISDTPLPKFNQRQTLLLTQAFFLGVGYLCFAAVILGNR